MASLCSSCVWKSIVATVPADLSSIVSCNDARVAGRLVWIVFDSDLTLITDDKHTDAWLADSLTRGDRLTGSDSILIRLDHG